MNLGDTVLPLWRIKCHIVFKWLQASLMTFINHYVQMIIVNNYNATRLQLRIWNLKN
jgi:hypothetical protein